MALFNSGNLADIVARRLDKEAMALVAESRPMVVQGIVHAALSKRRELPFQHEQS